ncbi:unnamed protein product [Blepharisma stoltei]|uniref:Uncharacterized protein n=1 Tax=Blepharisma stoltei TaxID=1481888 RepID=A0AAU9JZP8_9CILI|nr:unnamed protein product [Blepharisma stoltei]
MNSRLGNYKPILTSGEVTPYLNFRKNRPKPVDHNIKTKTLNSVLFHFIREKINESPLLSKNKPRSPLSSIILPSERQTERRKTHKIELEPLATETFDFENDKISGKLRIPIPQLKMLNDPKMNEGVRVQKARTMSLSRLSTLSQPNWAKTSSNSPIKERNECTKVGRQRYSSASLLNPIGKILRSKGINIEENLREKELSGIEVSSFNKKKSKWHENKRSFDGIVPVYLTARN